MTFALIRRELRLLRPLLIAAVLLPLLLAVLANYLQSVYDYSASSTAALYFWLCGAIPLLLTGLLLPCQLVAGDKEKGRFAALMQLPVSPARVWTIKFLTGFLLFLIYGVTLMTIVVSYGAAGNDAIVINTASGLEDLLRAAEAVLFASVCYYAVAFTVACFSRNSLTALVASAMVIALLFGGAIASVDFLLEMPEGLLKLIFKVHEWDEQNPYAQLLGEILVRVLGYGIILVFIGVSFAYFRYFQRRLPVIRKPFRKILFYIILPLVYLLTPVILWLFLLLIINHPARNEIVSPVLPAVLTDPSHIATQQQFAYLTQGWDDALEIPIGVPLDECETQTVIMALDYSFDSTLAANDSTAQLAIRLTATWRDQLLPFIASNDLTTYVNPEIDVHAFQPGYYEYWELGKLVKAEMLAINALSRQGRRTEAERRYVRLFTALRHLRSPGTLMQVNAYVQTNVIVAQLPRFLPLTGEGGTTTAQAIDQELLRMEQAARADLPVNIQIDLWRGVNAIKYSAESGSSLYPFGNAACLVADLSRIAGHATERARRPFSENPVLGETLPALTLSERFLRPDNRVALENMGQAFDNVRFITAIDIDTMRLGRVYLRAWRFQRKHRRLPVSLDELWSAGGEPITSELTGKPYPYAEIFRNGAFDPSAWLEDTARDIRSIPQ